MSGSERYVTEFFREGQLEGLDFQKNVLLLDTALARTKTLRITQVLHLYG